MARGGLKPAGGQALRPAQDAHFKQEVQDLAPHGEVDPLFFRLCTSVDYTRSAKAGIASSLPSIFFIAIAPLVGDFRFADEQLPECTLAALAAGLKIFPAGSGWGPHPR